MGDRPSLTSSSRAHLASYSVGYRPTRTRHQTPLPPRSTSTSTPVILPAAFEKAPAHHRPAGLPGLLRSAGTAAAAVNDWVATRDFGQRLNPLLASFFYFLIPSVFLGTISPYAIRLSAKPLATVGSTALC